mmetsp:Transcript_23990/g.51007  ORF Transcript_23990/g.51007 Transcript_23990/m.51007 type:complete len:464 (-) Transcript_23990:55-1446(-)|eukprot:CAMPEP_0201129266 /NCGR_PEP_ID=MMETSP0850-20130426/36349_1 /ASSEMBLY_ACC=CAM_ASM_000622 /TAXON_ID=183588 /ORGANISM="Pseudo-nitzschia fraudulenta, Strain WWA7" /LENGTH=463 /DNA_ID=CAMNT_0047398691 /DNA_START=96 /DNA_END=1487 /DNA_ORIENTATION=+
MFLRSSGIRASRAFNSRRCPCISTNPPVVPFSNRRHRDSSRNSEPRALLSSLPSSKTTGQDENTENTPSVVEHKESPIDFSVSSKIDGEESQVATIKLRAGEKLRAESGSMLFMTHGVEMATNLGGGGASSAFQRMMTGQNVFLTDFTYNDTNDAKGSGSVALGTDFPSKIVRLSLDDYGGSLVAQRGAYLASNASVDIQMEFTRTMTGGFFGGQGFILQRLVGEGDVLIKAGGTLVERYLEDGEELRVTSGSIVSFEPTVSYDVQMMPGVKNVMFGGEGLFVTTLTGPGRCWLQSMPPDRMIAEIASRVPAGGGFGPIIPVPGIGASGGGVEGAPGGAAGVPIDPHTNMDADVEGQNDPSIDEGVASSSPTMDGDSSVFSNTVGETEGFESTSTTTFNDEELDFTEPTFSDDTTFSSDAGFDQQDDFFGDDETEIFDTGVAEEASEAGSSILSTLWDIITGD